MLHTGFLTFISRKKCNQQLFDFFPRTFFFLHYFKSCSIFFKHVLNKSLVKNPSKEPILRRRGLERRKKGQNQLSGLQALFSLWHAKFTFFFFNFRAFKRILCCHRNWGSPISSFEQKRNQNDASNKRNFRKYFSMDFLKSCWKSQVRNEYRICTYLGAKINCTFS